MRARMPFNRKGAGQEVTSVGLEDLDENVNLMPKLDLKMSVHGN